MQYERQPEHAGGHERDVRPGVCVDHGGGAPDGAAARGVQARHPTVVRDLTEGYLAFGDSTWTDGRGSTHWAGAVHTGYRESAFQERKWQIESIRTSLELIGALVDVPPSHVLQGRFTQAANGVVSFPQTREAVSAPRLRIEAVRVSTTVLRQPQP